MCGTCGCGTDGNGPTILKPGEHTHSHNHDHDHHHHDDHHHHHDHSHDHSHDHDHSHSHKQRVIEVEKDVLQNNDILAARNRGYFEAKNVFALNLVSSPGSGKTSILEKTLTDLKEEIPFYVIEGDQQTLNDANRIDALNIPVVQINTGKGCHLESDMVYDAVKKLEMKNDSILMIENVGNLVCPSMFDLGENKRVVIISTTEGEDKPIKYPDMFHTADICIINKIDLLPYVNIDMDKLKNYALQVNPNLAFFEISATNGDGMDAWYKWLKDQV
ncbi:Hydrogenase nickel incorporation protein HypB [Lutibacter oricola]|uniref:Hydrogenase nickel incorporation protein HypB n=1 Tax=Lutibacter oricola TaxID=762486 RepID=A0A1H2S7G8_9FLAO|nr:hydrogenase nickel incorporation protein HypB [Lutibacter oricola]SDW27460.1 Hydrogenase nickel incorporation protein HypB [Lutibacter oricola]